MDVDMEEDQRSFLEFSKETIENKIIESMRNSDNSINRSTYEETLINEEDQRIPLAINGNQRILEKIKNEEKEFTNGTNRCDILINEEIKELEDDVIRNPEQLGEVDVDDISHDEDLINDERTKKMVGLMKDHKKMTKFIDKAVQDETLMKNSFEVVNRSENEKVFGQANALSGTKKAKKIGNSTNRKSRKSAIHHYKQGNRAKQQKKINNSFYVVEILAKKKKPQFLEKDFEDNDRYENYTTYILYDEEDIQIKLFYNMKCSKVNKVIRNSFHPDERIGGTVYIIKMEDNLPVNITVEDLKLVNFILPESFFSNLGI